MAKVTIAFGVLLILVGAGAFFLLGQHSHGIHALIPAAFGLLLVVFGSLIGFTAYVWLMRVSTPAHVSTISYVNLVVAVLLGWTVGGEPMTTRLLVGAGIIVGSVVLVLTKKANAELVDTAPTEA